MNISQKFSLGKKIPFQDIANFLLTKIIRQLSRQRHHIGSQKITDFDVGIGQPHPVYHYFFCFRVKCQTEN